MQPIATDNNYKLLLVNVLLQTAFLLSSIQYCHSLFSQHQIVYYVTPSSNVSCPGQPCRLLTEYNVSSNSKYLFLPGTHVFSSDTVLIKEVTNVTLQALNTTSLAPTLKCLQDRKGGLLLQNVTNFEVKWLTILNCTARGSTAIWVEDGTNVVISGIKLYNVRFGIYIENVDGNVSIIESNIEAEVTSIYISHHDVSACDTPTVDNINDDNKMLSTTIQDVYTSGGETGLYIHQDQSCFRGEIVIRNLHSEGSKGVGNVHIKLSQYQHNHYSLLVDNMSTVHGESQQLDNGGGGGGFALEITNRMDDVSCGNEADLIYITNTNIEENRANLDGGGLLMKFISLCRTTNVLLNNVTFHGNTAMIGGHFSIYENITRGMGQAKYQIINCTIKDGWSVYSSTLILIEHHYNTMSNETQPNDKILISGTQFVNNTVSVGNGGGISINIVVYSDHLLSTVANVLFQNIVFLENQCAQQGSAVSLLGDYPHIFYNFTFLDVTIQEQISTSPIARVGAVYIESVFQVNFINSSFLDNNSSALFLFNSEVHLQGTVHFERNRGYNGGAIALCGGSYVSFHYDSQVYFLDNTAEHVGGAIFVQENCFLSGITYCFYRIAFPNSDGRDFIGNLVFEGNVAQAGYDIYGGQVRDCSEREIIGTRNTNNDFEVLFSSLASAQNCNSRISSNPEQVRFCSNNNDCPDSNTVTRYMELYPGKNFDISVAILGQEHGLVPGVVHAVISQTEDTTIDAFQDSQTVHGNCTTVNYTVFGPTGTLVSLTLSPEQPDGSFLDTSEDYYSSTSRRTVSVEILLEECPIAFVLNVDDRNKSMCDCEPNLKRHGVQCNIDDETLQPPVGIWIGYHNETNHDNSTALESGMLLHVFCPVRYCKSTYPAMTITNLDDQCSSSRSGVLCGACKHGYSMILGSSECKQCSHATISLLLLFLLCGIILVAFLRITNLTVSTATINGLIFYVNIIHTNRSTFLSSNGNFLSKIFTVFLAWLNLDFGIEWCFYDGMDTFTKLFLQYLFPIYIWILMITLIVIGHYKTGKVVRFIIGKNGVQVLATLFLLSYTKLQRVVINTLHFTTLPYPNGDNKIVWVLDGNVQYLEGKHIPLFIAALMTLVFLIIPFTLLITFAQFIQRGLNYFRPGRNSNARLWVLHDAYSGKYKNKYRFWTGLLLIVRTILLLVFSFNVHGDPNVNLLAIGLTSSCLLVFFSSATDGGMYKLKLLNLLELSFLFNLLLLALCTLYIRQTTQPAQVKQEIVADISVGIAFITFIAILVYHLIKYTFPRHIDHLRRKLTHRYHVLWHHSESQEEDDESELSSTRSGDERELSGMEVDSIEYILGNSGDLELVAVNDESSEDSSLHESYDRVTRQT